ncbi:MAG: hypothetical protein IPJ81_16355 [Chitinophagaceae bacterium]|nr:hypothetical protein [Chitinophagaceae bacterium]
MEWALANRKKLDIKNIALNGPYGSGKSNILKTYSTSYKGNDLHFLNISLATFKEEEKPDISSKDELLRLIELSILQQIFYHEEDHKIPDSRFRKIKNYTPTNLVFTTLALFLIIVSALYLIQPNLVESLLKIKFNSRVAHFLHYTSLVFTTVCCTAYLY